MGITVRLAAPSEIPSTEELLLAAYGERGYCPGAIATGTEQYFALERSHTLVLVAEQDGVLRGTMRTTLDEGTLPIDEEFPAAIAKLRSSAAKICYYSRFAVNPMFWGARRVGLALIAEAFRLAKYECIDACVIVVHPHHVDFYQRMMFRVVDEIPCIPGLEKAPAVLMILALRELQADNQVIRRSAKQAVRQGKTV